jgi:hypothetical protein
LSCVLAAAFFLNSALAAAEASVQVVRVCDVIRDLPSYVGKVVAIVGRLSYREEGRFISEETCEGSKTGNLASSNVIPVFFDIKAAPKPLESSSIDPNLVYKELEIIKRRTALANFRFGSEDYDRWAVAYGRLEMMKDPSPRPKNSGKKLAPTPARLICASASTIVFLAN